MTARTHTAGVVLAALTMACSTSERSAPIAKSRSVLTRLASMPAFAERFGARGAGHLRVELPEAITDPVRLVPTERPSAWLEIRALDVSGRGSALEGSARVHTEALLSTDVVQMPIADGFEEIRWLKDPRAKTVARYALRFDPSVASLRVREGHVELVEGDGRVALASAPMFAVDAEGVRRSVTQALEISAGSAVLTTNFDATGMRHPIAVDPLFSTAAPLSVARSNCHPVALSGGKAMVVGCGTIGAGTASNTAEIYDLATNTWSAAAPMSVARFAAGSVYLSAVNKVLVAGGTDGASTNLSSVELYDVATNTWSSGTAMSTGRSYPRLVAIGSGARALLIDTTTKSEVYDPTAKTWTVTGAMPIAHPVLSTVTLLPDGRVAVTGGGVYPSTNPLNLSLFTPSGAGGTWTSGATMTEGRGNAGAAVVGGKLLVAGGSHYQGIPSGFTYVTTNSAELWNPATNAWVTLNPLAKSGPTFVTELSSGRGYVFESGNLEVFEPSTSTWGVGGASTAGILGVTLSTRSDVLLMSSDGLANQLFRLSTGGTTCTVASECATGFCTAGACCSTATCPAGSVCNAPKKPGVCAKVDGATCTTASECDSGFCVDGVCCNAACTGQCQACNVAGKAGTCSPVVGAPHGTRTACGGAGDPDVCKRLACDGVDATACHHPGGAITCGAATCTSGVETHVSTCNGSGACADVPKSCGSYTCGPTACRTTCGSPPDCTAGYYCDLTKALCVPISGLGGKCSATEPCPAGLYCTDGVCCGKSSCGAGSTCAATGKEGTCTKKNGIACLAAAECGTGLCVDGVCCDTKCDGQCEACDVKGSVGTCSPVAGKPHGARPGCGAGTDACNVPLCDGVERASCKGFVGTDVECRAASCTAGTLTARAVCSAGSCPAAVETSCDGYTCVGDKCRTTCSGASDCIDGYTCIAGACTKKTTSCSPDGLQVVKVDGSSSSCAPYRCKGGACVDQCASSDDCAPNTVCQLDTRICTGAPTTDEGGCTFGHASARTASFALFALAALGLCRRRMGRTS